MTTAAARIRDRFGGWWGRWPRWIGYAAAVWSLALCLLAAGWALGGPGFPWGAAAEDPKDPSDDDAFFVRLEPGSAGTVVAVAAGLGVLVALVAARSRRRGVARVLLAGYAVLTIVGLVSLVDARVIMALGYLVPVVVGAPFGWPPTDGDAFALLFPWPVVFQLLCMLGAFCWYGALVAHLRRTREACGNCGRAREGEAGWTAPAAAARWGRIAAYASMVPPLLYAAERYAWALGIPLGGDQALVDDLHETGLWVAGFGLGTMAVFGVVMTFGLIHRWGEVFPRWIPLLGGRRVPTAFPVGCFVLVSTSLIAMGLQLWTTAMDGETGSVSTASANQLLGLATMTLLPLWGVGMLVATAGYYFRRRGRCAYCGLPAPAPAPR